MNTVLRFLRDRSGAPAIEYAMIAGGIAVVIVAAIASVGSATSAKFTAVSNAFE